MYKVENIEVDLIEYEGHMCLQAQLEYKNESEAILVVKRIDTLNKDEGWNDNIKVSLHDYSGNTKEVEVGPSKTSNMKRIEAVSLNNTTFIKSSTTIESNWITSYKPFRQFEHFPVYQSRSEFCNTFQVDLPHLPSSMFALGMKDGGAFIYHDNYRQYPWDYEIRYTIDFILSMMFARTPGVAPPTFYCILCALDGYIEHCYPSMYRTIPKRVEDNDGKNKMMIDMSEYGNTKYPIFHDQKYILCQSARKHMPYTIPVIDRYYLYLNRYNGYRSIHRGILFSKKIAKVVYAGNERGSKYNFLLRRDINMSQREYFTTDAVSKKNVRTGYVPRDEMIKYKYILDIDGNACTWDATAWKLNSGSVIFKTNSDWTQWFYSEYLPWKHYVPVKEDFSDLNSKYKWCEKHPKECEEMISNCKRLFHKVYRHDSVVHYMSSVIDKLVDEYKNK